MKIEVPIDNLEMRAVEKLYYEYNTGLDILNFLLNREKIDEKIFQTALLRVETNGATLEILKNKLNNKYKPKDTDSNCTYTFNFITNMIEYQ